MILNKIFGLLLFRHKSRPSFVDVTSLQGEVQQGKFQIYAYCFQSLRVFQLDILTYLFIVTIKTAVLQAFDET